MLVRFACPHCKTALSAPTDAGGKKSKCPKCGSPVEVPAANLELVSSEAKRMTEFDDAGRTLTQDPNVALATHDGPGTLPPLPDAPADQEAGAETVQEPLAPSVQQYILILRFLFLPCVIALPFFFLYVMDNDGKLLSNPLWLVLTAVVAGLTGWCLWPGEAMARWRGADSHEAQIP
jgi:hypothetical protein